MRGMIQEATELIERSRFLSDLAARLGRFRHSLGSAKEDVTWVQRVGMVLVLLALPVTVLAPMTMQFGLLRYRWHTASICRFVAALGGCLESAVR